MRAILLAKTTRATLSGRRWRNSFTQGSGSLACIYTERAPWISKVRK